MKNWKSFLLLALVFFAGIAVGVVGTRLVVRRVVQQALAHPERAQSLMERNLTRRLRLDNQQQVKLHEILSGTRGQLRDLRREIQPQAALVLSNANAQITAILTQEQQARYEKFKERNWPALRAMRAGP